jgi:hypothetical protein
LAGLRRRAPPSYVDERDRQKSQIIWIQTLHLSYPNS